MGWRHARCEMAERGKTPEGKCQEMIKASVEISLGLSTAVPAGLATYYVGRLASVAGSPVDTKSHQGLNPLCIPLFAVDPTRTPEVLGEP